MKQGIQTFLAEAGEAACYALDIIRIAELHLGKELDALIELDAGIINGYIYYNQNNSNDNRNFFVENPAAFLQMMTGAEWEVTKQSATYLPRQNEYVVDRWERVKTGTVIGHFRLPDWDSLANSKTVEYGTIVSKRVFRRKI